MNKQFYTADNKIRIEAVGNYEIWKYEQFGNGEWKLQEKNLPDLYYLAVDGRPVYIHNINYSTFTYSFLNTDINSPTCGACYQVVKKCLK